MCRRCGYGHGQPVWPSCTPAVNLHPAAAQGRFSNPALDPKAAEALFKEHVLELQKRAADAYIELLDEVGPPSCCVRRAPLVLALL